MQAQHHGTFTNTKATSDGKYEIEETITFTGEVGDMRELKNYSLRDKQSGKVLLQESGQVYHTYSGNQYDGCQGLRFHSDTQYVVVTKDGRDQDEEMICVLPT